jgi:lipopolysaccharide/colanic/teichoic acid biosynthesis glycosyltransferase
MVSYPVGACQPATVSTPCLERWSVLLDLVILLKTVPAVLRRRGAY